MDPNQLRQKLLALRGQVSAAEQSQASHAVCTQILDLPIFKTSQHIGIYTTWKGEIDLSVLPLKYPHKNYYLPCLDPAKTGVMGFAHHAAPQQENRYSIAEPALPKKEWFPAEQLDLVLVPLVAFDAQGHRLGMGKGYYDRCFAFLNQDPRPKKPVLLGVAYKFQEVQRLDTQEWDVHLDGVIMP